MLLIYTNADAAEWSYRWHYSCAQEFLSTFLLLFWRRRRRRHRRSLSLSDPIKMLSKCIFLHPINVCLQVYNQNIWFMFPRVELLFSGN